VKITIGAILPRFRLGLCNVGFPLEGIWDFNHRGS
jgi:hypothetical protein